MSWLRAFRQATVAALGIAAITRETAGHAELAGDACPGPRVVVEQDLAPEWRRSISQLLADLTVGADWDPCAVVTLLPAGHEMIAHVKLHDGRAAVRRVSAASDLVSTVEALLLVIPQPLFESPVEAKRAWADEARDEKIDAPASAFALGRDATPHIELGLGADARTLGSPLLWGAGALFTAQMALGSWLIATDGRWDAFDAPVTIAAPSGFNMQTFAVGVAVGRRFAGDAVHTDVLLGPEAVVENEEADGPDDGVGGSTSDFRVHLTTRVLAARSKPIHWFGAFDIDVSPARIGKATRLDSALPTSPSWSAGLGLGLLWEAR